PLHEGPPAVRRRPPGRLRSPRPSPPTLLRARVQARRRPPPGVPGQEAAARHRRGRVRRDGGPGHARGPPRGAGGRDRGRVRRARAAHPARERDDLPRLRQAADRRAQRRDRAQRLERVVRHGRRLGPGSLRARAPARRAQADARAGRDRREGRAHSHRGGARRPPEARVGRGGRVTAMLWLAVLRVFGAREADMRAFVSREELKALLQMEPGEAAVTTQEAELIDNIFDLGDTTVREVMVPLVEVAMLPETASPWEAITLIRERGFSRIPIYRQRETSVVGIVAAMDLLSRGAQVTTLAELGRPPYYVPETKRIDDLLREMQRARTHMAVVVDEYGGSTG